MCDNMYTDVHAFVQMVETWCTDMFTLIIYPACMDDGNDYMMYAENTP